MNANELADELEVIFTTYSDEATFEQAAAMLRQQQAEIEALKGACRDLKKLCQKTHMLLEQEENKVGHLKELVKRISEGFEISLELNKAQAERNIK